MSYRQFNTLRKALVTFDLTLEEHGFLPEIPAIAPSMMLQSYLEETLPSVTSSSEKARSEGIIYPLLVEVRRILHRQISVFSGEDFTVDESQGLNGVVDFLISRSPLILTIQSPVAVIVEAKKADITTGLGQCVAEMVAAQRFNQTAKVISNIPLIDAIYGSVSNGMQWRFLKLEGQTVTADLTDYPLLPVDRILGYLTWMAAGEVISSR
jgi:hypothetical protein